MKVLVVEDDVEVARGLVRGLRAASFEVELLTTGSQAIERLNKTELPDFMILDLMLPERNGYEVLEFVASRAAIASAVPILVLTATTALDERLRCFRQGAVDFMTKPFWMEELVERIRVRLGRRELQPRAVERWADAELDFDALTVTVAGQPVNLTRTELNVLSYLVKRPDRAVSRRQLAEECLVVGDGDTDERNVDTYVGRIRKKLGKSGANITTVWGIGYRFTKEPLPR